MGAFAMISLFVTTHRDTKKNSKPIQSLILKGPHIFFCDNFDCAKNQE